jgi:hypothetical protein
MMEMVEARRNSDNVEQRYDLFNGLLDAAQDELDDGAALSDEELIGGCSMSLASFEFLESVASAVTGNMFIFLLAGHEVRSSSSSCPVT